MKKEKYIRIACLLLLSFLFLSGCVARTDTDGGYVVYTKNLTQTGLKAYPYAAQSTAEEDIILELWTEMVKNPEERDETSVVPEGIVLERFVIDGNNLNLYFNEQLQTADSVDQLLLRAAAVHSFTGVEGIETVTFFSNDKTLTDSSYSALGAQKASDYVDIIGNGLSTVRKTTLVLYFTDQTGEHLIQTSREIVYESSYSLERDVIDRLIQGPTKDGCFATLPSTAELISVNTKNGVCYVNFSAEFVSDALPLDGEIILYSIVNSLCELSDVNQVQILVSGESDIMFKDISLAAPFERNLNFCNGM